MQRILEQQGTRVYHEFVANVDRDGYSNKHWVLLAAIFANIPDLLEWTVAQ